MKLWKILGAGIGAVWLTGTVVTMSTPAPAKSRGPAGNVAASSPEAVAAPAPRLSQWSCSDSVDNMRGTQINICMVESTNVADFEFPYDKPNNRLSISVRKWVQGSARQAIIGI